MTAEATITRRTVQVTTGPFAPYTQTVCYQRRISADLVIHRETSITWSGYSHTLNYLPVEDDDHDGRLGRYAGSLGYHDSDWLATTEALEAAQALIPDAWARWVAPYVAEGKEPRL